MTEVKDKELSVKAEPKDTPAQNAGPWDAILGAESLEVGQIGFGSLDEAGNITGIYLVPPEVGSGVSAVRVRRQDTGGGRFHAIVSESGAELNPPVNPNPDIRWEPSDATTYEASEHKFEESRENGTKRTVGAAAEDKGKPGTDFGPSPQLAGAYDKVPTHSQAGRGEEGKAVAGVSETSKVEGDKTVNAKTTKTGEGTAAKK